jgi:DNA-binding NarL/FixJ family response regulator
MKNIKIFIIDDHPIVRRGLSNFVKSRKGYTVCGEASDANMAIARINSCNPDVAIVDISLGQISGLSLIKNLSTRYPNVRILVLTMHNEIEYLERAFDEGARGYILKSDREELIFDAIDAIINGRKYISSSMKDLMIEKMLWDETDKERTISDKFTERENEILNLIGNGFSSKEIAEKLNLSISTIGTYRERIKKKLKIINNSELVRFAVARCLEKRNTKTQ